ncbi:glycosyltransferase family 2 protein [Flavobacterium sp.]|uniref:glycosyltransferase family 2 protein n=1 Tax=Flavobacterium sp. TaxID=239 RepID=UPI002B4B02AF|nr:glycosyltransferase [Flavobacterium sp.]HLF51219.1 glycosyltransferase [Flavobacterium sp.]
MNMEQIMPLISVCLPVYNGENYLKEALASLSKQTYTNIELIVSDDNSKDRSLSLINEFSKNVHFPVYIYNHLPNSIGGNWNNCIEKANGEYIKFLFQDDVLEPTCIEEMVRVYNTYPNAGLITCKRNFIVEENSNNEATYKWIDTFGDLQMNICENSGSITVLNKKMFSNIEFLKSPLNKIGEPTTVLFKKEIVKKIGLFDTQLKQILDYEYWYRILKIKDIIVINKPLVKFRIHQEQETNVNRNKKIDDYDIYDKILFDKYLALLHPEVQKKLRNKFSTRYKWICFLKKISRKIKKKVLK